MHDERNTKAVRHRKDILEYEKGMAVSVMRQVNIAKFILGF
jgi:hypothetical protein